MLLEYLIFSGLLNQNFFGVILLQEGKVIYDLGREIGGYTSLYLPIP
jgi:hypothetical protein